MAGKDGATIDNHILTGPATTASVGILAALDADAIIAGIETRVDNQRILARLQVECIAVLGISRIAHEHIADDDVLAHERMEVPSR